MSDLDPTYSIYAGVKVPEVSDLSIRRLSSLSYGREEYKEPKKNCPLQLTFILISNNYDRWLTFWIHWTPWYIRTRK